ncbi:MAG: sugar phosphate isomerase/epimerase [Chloroflexi bacterium]|nr:sugar phosphate isomerase/epimerase [Chloroflexota bacterium]
MMTSPVTMKLCYALRRGVYYPSQRDAFGEMPPKELRPRYLRAVKRLGFEGVEIPSGSAQGATAASARELREEMEDAGLPPVAVRGGGAVAHPRLGASVRANVERTLQFASWVGAGVVNLTAVTPPTHPGGPGAARTGEPVSQGASRLASEDDFQRTADALRALGQVAADFGLQLSIEVHQGSIADNSWSALHLLDLIGLGNVGVNPDLGNVYWQYDLPEETCEAAIVALAPRARYWHCKNLKRVHIPELRRSIYLRVPLPDGDIDYRFAISAMADAGYTGFIAVEGARDGDQLTADGRSAAYVRGLLAELGEE